MSQDQVAEVVYLYDRRYWPSMQFAWQEGLAALCPEDIDVGEWRASARRLARHLECRVRTGMRKVRVKNGTETTELHRFTAEANDGYPLGLTDPHDRDAWARQQVEADG